MHTVRAALAAVVCSRPWLAELWTSVVLTAATWLGLLQHPLSAGHFADELYSLCTLTDLADLDSYLCVGRRL